MSDAAHAFDVIVVGCGIAGLSAAVSAQEAGARVALLERAPMPAVISTPKSSAMPLCLTKTGRHC